MNKYVYIIIIICLIVLALVYLLSPVQATIVTSMGAGLAIARRKRDKMQTRLERAELDNERRSSAQEAAIKSLNTRSEEREKWLDR